MILTFVSISMLLFALLLMYNWGLITFPQIKSSEKNKAMHNKDVVEVIERNDSKEEDLVL